MRLRWLIKKVSYTASEVVYYANEKNIPLWEASSELAKLKHSPILQYKEFDTDAWRDVEEVFE